MATKEHRDVMTGGTPMPQENQSSHRSMCQGTPSTRSQQGGSLGHPSDWRHHAGIQAFLWGAGKSISGLHRTSCAMFRGSNEGGEREGSQGFGEVQVWLDRGRRGEKVQTGAGMDACLAMPAPDQRSQSQLLTKLHVQ